MTLPDPEAMRTAVVDQLAFMDEATNRHHCRGTKIIPFSMHNVDEVLGDLDVNIGAAGPGLALDQPDRPGRLQGNHPTRARDAAQAGRAARARTSVAVTNQRQTRRTRMTIQQDTAPATEHHSSSRVPARTWAPSASESTSSSPAPRPTARTRCSSTSFRPDLGGPPTHIHSREDELFICAKGRVRVELDGVEHILEPGLRAADAAGRAAHVPQPFDEETRIIAVVSPPGLENYYRGLSQLPPGRDMKLVADVMDQFGLSLVPRAKS